MAYNSYYNYPYYPQQIAPQVQVPQQQQASSSQGLIWVQGEGAAKSYLVAPGNTVALFDNESQTIYIKSADASGMPSMRVLDYTFRDASPQNKQIFAESEFATKEDISVIRNEIEALRAKLSDVEGSKKK